MKDLRRGLPMVAERDPAALESEKRYLNELSKASPLTRIGGYLKLSGPGYMQSAMTLGSGTAMAALFAGAALSHAGEGQRLAAQGELRGSVAEEAHGQVRVGCDPGIVVVAE